MPITRRHLLGRLGVGAAAAAAAPALAEAALASVNAPPVRGPGNMLRLHRNENGYGPSTRVIRALQDSVANVVQRYPEYEADALRRRLASLHGVTPDRIVLGCGASEVLQMAAEAFLGPRTKVVTARPTFDVLGRFAEQRGATVVALPLTEQHAHDLERMLTSVDGSTGLVYICNPNNPTGTLTRRQDLEAFLRRLPQRTYVVIDEAYHHYVDPSAEYASFIDRPIDDPRIVVTRSFSKLFGLAGARVGYAVAAPSTARMLSACRLPDGVNALAATSSRGSRRRCRTRADDGAAERQRTAGVLQSGERTNAAGHRLPGQFRHAQHRSARGRDRGALQDQPRPRRRTLHGVRDVHPRVARHDRGDWRILARVGSAPRSPPYVE